MDCAFRVVPKNSLSNPRSQKLPLMFSLNSVVLGFAFCSTFELNFVYMYQYRSELIFLYMNKLLQYCLLGRFSSSEFPLHLSKADISHKVRWCLLSNLFFSFFFFLANVKDLFISLWSLSSKEIPSEVLFWSALNLQISLIRFDLFFFFFGHWGSNSLKAFPLLGKCSATELNPQTPDLTS